MSKKERRAEVCQDIVCLETEQDMLSRVVTGGE